ncbi:response regulator transcription factor [Luteimonas sp. 22616]|uniref:response regulator transcription factor n=1 Tax=Luteimonas sp. 22616 TaxID=3453951 RepID=UPI003F862997
MRELSFGCSYETPAGRGPMASCSSGDWAIAVGTVSPSREGALRAGEIAQCRKQGGNKVADGDRQWILVVEDDPELRDEILRPGLHDAGFDTVGVGSAIEAYRSMLSRDFSMFILDIGLPDEDGFTLARNLRALTSAGIVMLTGRRRSSADTARGLDEGADAYITKPVDIDVLSANVRSILRRRNGQVAPSIRYADSRWRLDMEGWSLVAPGGRSIRLNHAERMLVELLFASRSEAVPRKTIIAHLTRDIHDFDPHRLEMLVHRLRRKAFAGTGESLPLNAVRGIGYVLTPSRDSAGAVGTPAPRGRRFAD